MPSWKNARLYSDRLTTVDQAKCRILGRHPDRHPAAKCQGIGRTHDAIVIGAHPVAHTGKPGVDRGAGDAGIVG